MVAPDTPLARGLRLGGAALAGLAVAVGVALYLTGLGDSFANSDEVIYAEFIRTMHRSGDWLTVKWQDAVVLQRPAAPIALYAAVSAVVPGEFGLRFLPTLLTIAAAAAAGAIVWRRFAAPAVGVATFLLVLGIPSVHVYGRMLLSDPPFVLAVTLALGATMAAVDRPRWFVWACAALGAAFASKSLAAGIPALGLAPWLFVAWRRHRRAARPLLGAVAFVALAAPFYVIGLAQHGQRFVREHFGYNLVGRAAGELEGIGIGGPEAYLRHMFNADGAPVFLVLLGGIAGAAVLAVRRRDAALGAAATVSLVMLLGLSAVKTRLPHYLLVFYPAAAICAGGALATLLRARPRFAPLATAAAAALMLVTTARAPFDVNAYPSVEARELGAAARGVDATIYSLDWYAPALGYYADARWRLLTTSERMARIVGGIDLFAAAGTVERVPPWPEGAFAVVGFAAELDAKLPRPSQVVARSGELELRRVAP